MKAPDIYFYEAFEEEQAALESFMPDSIHAGFTADTIQEAGHIEPPARIICLRTQSVIPSAWSTKMDALLSRSTGFDHLLAYRAATGTTAALAYLPLYCARAVAEQALLLWTALARKLPLQTAQFRTFHRDGITGREIAGKTLLVIGVGNIGSEIVRIGQGLDMTVWGVDPAEKHPFVDYVEFEDKKVEADIMVCAMNLTKENHGYFSAERFSGIKPDALFINIARGELAPPEVLLTLIKNRQLGGVGMDVYDAESELAVALRTGQPSENRIIRASLELQRLPNVICTPHNAFNTQEAVVRKSEQSIQQVESFLNTGEFIWKL